MSTANPERAQKLVADGWSMIDQVKVPAIGLAELAKKSKELGFGQPDVVSIDLEMVDFLEDIPPFLKTLQPRLLCMESVTHTISIKTLFSSKETSKLTEAGYEPISIIGGNIFAKPVKTTERPAIFG